MAYTYLYLPSSGTSPLPSLAVADYWDCYSDDFFRAPCSPTKTDTPLTDNEGTFPSSSSQQMCFAQWVSPPLAEDTPMTTSESVDFVVRTLEGDEAVDACTAMVVRAVSNDGSEVHDEMRVYLSTSNEFATGTAATKINSGSLLDSPDIVIGDRIVVEMGANGVTPDTNYSAIMRFGDPSGTSDFPRTAGLTTDLCPWVRFNLADEIAFSPEPAGGVVIPSLLQTAIYSRGVMQHG